jgi:hypothetical protein
MLLAEFPVFAARMQASLDKLMRERRSSTFISRSKRIP